jgi:HAD superfamily hydrolase (TIGR01509 family)
MKRYGLIFDNDGVICDTEAANARATIRVFEDLFGLKGVEPGDFAAGIGRGAAPYVVAAADVHGLKLSEPQVEAAVKLRQDYFLEDIAKNPVRVFPGVRRLIDAGLERADFSVAIATSADLEKSREVLKSTKIPYDRMVYVTGNDVARKKPDPDIFLAAADRMALEPGRCAVIEDSPDGVAAAKAAGMACVAVTNTVDAGKLSAADVICESVEQIALDAIAQLIDGG